MWRRGGGFSACVRRRRAVRLPRLGDFPKSGNPNRDPPCTGESISAFRKAPEPARLRGRVGCEFGLRRRVARRRRVAGGGECRVGGRVGVGAGEWVGCEFGLRRRVARRRRVAGGGEGRVGGESGSAVASGSRRVRPTRHRGRAVFRKAEIQTAIPPAPGKVFPLFGRRPPTRRARLAAQPRLARVGGGEPGVGGGEGRVGGRVGVGGGEWVAPRPSDATSGRAVFQKAEIQTAIPPAPGKVFPLFGRRPSQARLRGDLGLCGVVGRRPSRARLRGDLGCAAGSQGARARRGGAATLGRAAWSRGSDSAAHPSRSTGRPTTAPRTRPRRAGAASCGSRSPLDAASRLRRCVPSSARSRAQRAQTASQRAFTAAAIATKRGSARNDSSRGQRSSQSLS